VARPRVKRLLAARARQETYLHHDRGTRPTRTSIKCWELVACELNLRIDNPPRRDTIVVKSDPVRDR
jgi:hypothetical protein